MRGQSPQPYKKAKDFLDFWVDVYYSNQFKRWSFEYFFEVFDMNTPLLSLRTAGIILIVGIISLVGSAVWIALGALYAAVMVPGSGSLPEPVVRTALKIIIGAYLLSITVMIVVRRLTRKLSLGEITLFLAAPILLYLSTLITLKYFELWLWLIAWATIFRILYFPRTG